jgi:hypothetical protein
MKRFALWLAGAVAVVGLALTGALPAGAATHPAVVHAGNVGTHYSAAFAGYNTDGNGQTEYNGIWRQVTVPDESTASPAVPANTVADGIIMGGNLSKGSYAVAEALVFDDPSSTCLPTQWTLEEGTGSITLVGGQPVLPTSDLNPVLYFGSDVCVNGGGTEFIYLYVSRKHHDADFSAGPSSKDWNVLDTMHGVPGIYRTAGAGISTCNTGDQLCNNPDDVNGAADLISGSVFDGSGVAFFVNGQGNSVFGQGKNMYTENYTNWEGTVSGGPPTPTNPITLLTNPGLVLSGPYGAYNEVVASAGV